MGLPQLHAVDDAAAVRSARWDAVVLVAPEPCWAGIPAIDDVLAAARVVDRRVTVDVGLLPAPGLAGGRLVVAPTGPVTRDADDVRRFGDAARAGLRRAAAAGAVRPLLVARGAPSDPAFARASEVALLEAAGATWSPLEAREARGEAAMEPVEAIGWQVEDVAAGRAAVPRLEALEQGRRVARDITGTEPERMAPPRVAEYCRQLFRDLPVSVEVLADQSVLAREYPLLAAVGRASLAVPRHEPCVVRLTYTPEGPVERSLLLAGKGVTYDTGGADVKYGGAMAGMSRDKGGAGAAIGLMATVGRSCLRGLKVVAEIGCVRNSIGSDGFVADEIITSHAGVRVRIGNTDAEGRLVLADILSHLRERALRLPRPRIFSLATLTGHAGRAYGPYTAVLENGPARAEGVAERLSRMGDVWGDPVEISRLRREDWAFVRPRSSADDVLSCNNAASTATPRGHQFPMAFLAIASGLERHGRDGSPPMAFAHVDIGGSATEGGDWQHGRPTGAPVVAFSTALLGLA